MRQFEIWMRQRRRMRTLTPLTPPPNAKSPLSLRAVAERITRDEVVHVARLARLELADDEIDQFTQQLGAILEHAADVEALEVADVEPTSGPLPLRNVMRADVVSESLERDEVMASAPDVQDGQFRVPPVLGEQP